VNLIRDRFGFYHASVFLLDPLGEYAVLRESTGEAGRMMKANQHNLAVGSRSIVGQATEKGKAVVVSDVTQEVNYYPNPLLPNTKAETAIPLIFSEKVIGALDVQSDQVDAFSPEDIEILGILADQLAATIHNAELFAAAEGMLGKHRLLHQINVAATSAGNLEESLERTVEGLSIARVADKIGILLLNNRDELELVTYAGYEKHNLPELRIPLGQGIIGAAAVDRHPIRVDNVLNDPRYIQAEQETRSELALPIVFGDDLIGVLNLEANLPAAFSENDQEIMGALANNLGAIIANWRLVDRIRRQVDQQKMLYEVTSRIRRSVDIPTILQTSVNEIGRTMGVRRARIKLLNPTTPGSAEVEPEHDVKKKNGKNGNKDLI
jgi:putative methionine-R-sulfoxide reductase with GAF domain